MKKIENKDRIFIDYLILYYQADNIKNKELNEFKELEELEEFKEFKEKQVEHVRELRWIF